MKMDIKQPADFSQVFMHLEVLVFNKSDYFSAWSSPSIAFILPQPTIPCTIDAALLTAWEQALHSRWNRNTYKQKVT